MAYIFESPDKGKTVYRKKLGSNERELYIRDNNPVAINYGMWGDIIRAAVDNPALQEAIDRVKIIYELTRDNN